MGVLIPAAWAFISLVFFWKVLLPGWRFATWHKPYTKCPCQGGHVYHSNRSVTLSCECGASLDRREGACAPDGIDPFGICPLRSVARLETCPQCRQLSAEAVS